MPRFIAFLLALALSLTGLGATIGAASAAPGDGSITGTVLTSAGQPVGDDVWVNADRWNPADDRWDESVVTTMTDAAGQYHLGSVPPGTYRVWAETDSGYLPGYWPGGEITVAAEQNVTGIHIRLALGATISGTVTSEAGNPLDGVEVVAWQWDPELEFWFWFDNEFTAFGNYDLTDLPPGAYRVEFRPTDRQPEFWNDARSLETARSITVGSGRTVSGIDAEIADGAMLGGKVTGVDHPEGLEDVDIWVYWWNSTSKMWDLRSTSNQTGADGSYLLRGLAPGAYRLSFVDFVNGRNYTSEYWPNDASLETAESIVVGTDAVWDKDVELSTDPFPRINNVTAPTIVGTPQVGQPLTATVGTWSATGLSYDYQWFVGLVPVFGATSATFTPPKGTGKTVRVRVVAYREGHISGDADSVESAALLPPEINNAALPAISGAPRVGATVTATPGTWNPGDAATSYQWLLDGQPVVGATSASYAAQPSDVGRALSVRVSASRSGWIATSATSAAATVAAGTLTATAKPKVTGKAKKRAVLKVSPGKWSPAGSVKIQWYAGAKAIKKATKPKLKLVGKTLKAVRKKAISVRVSVSAPGYSTVVTKLKVRGKVR